MIREKYVAGTIYISLIFQLITTFISLDGLNYDLKSDDNILKHILLLEAFVQFIEAGFYIWVIYALKDINKMTSRRYIDWFITTPTMLISTVLFMEYLRRREEGNKETINFLDFLRDQKQNITVIIALNFLMLLCGVLSENGLIDMKYGITMGFIFFFLSFYTIYDKYAKYTDIGRKLFIFLFCVWSLYGFAAMMPAISKNVSYNLLDIVAKNFYGMFIYYYITKIGIKKS